METLRIRLGVARQALKTFQELASLAGPTPVERDAAIQRFEYTCEALWKATQGFLSDVEGLQSRSPKSCIRHARDARVLDDKQAELALNMVNDRNLTSHTYNQELARQLYARLGDYSLLMEAWLAAMERRVTDA